MLVQVFTYHPLSSVFVALLGSDRRFNVWVADLTANASTLTRLYSHA